VEATENQMSGNATYPPSEFRWIKMQNAPQEISDGASSNTLDVGVLSAHLACGKALTYTFPHHKH
jgi:hypothetical protein